ncbi:MAG TPA: hypothetical protein VGQ58_01580 [Candidatus Limnocylindrales bacterium]|jgi:hypothetical protein|nr:hypothetical protein [Candidatus Limnocylindrales bacterium]
MPKTRRVAGVLLLLVLAVGACGNTERTPARVTISGAVFTDFHVDLPCADGPPAMRPDELSGIKLTFSDPQGVALGAALTGPLRAEPIADGCRFLADYQAVVPPAAIYRVEFDPPEPRTLPGGGYFDGAGQLAPQEIRHDQLVAAGFTWTFEAPPAFVVP